MPVSVGCLAAAHDALDAGSSAPVGYEVNWVPSMRYLVDLGDLDAGSWIHISGQSGRPFTTHYTDPAEPWAAGQTLPLRFTAAAVEAATRDRLVLRPADRTGDG